MIQDNVKKQEIEDDWKGVRSFQSRIQVHLNASGGIGSVGATHQLRNISHNLVLLFAFSVLESTLKQLRDEKVFQEKTNGLKALMHLIATIPLDNNRFCMHFCVSRVHRE